MLKHQYLSLILVTGVTCVSNPASARFVSADPASAQSHIQQGNIQGFNRYAYGNNNPYKFTDPDGATAVVNVDKNNNVNITLVNKYTGVGATPSVTSRFNNGIANTWSGQKGKYNVTVTVTVRAPNSSDSSSIINSINVVQGPQTSTTNMNRGSNGQLDATNSGAQWDNADTAGVAAHEAGHLMGVEDKYITVSTPSGQRKTMPTPGYRNNVMGDTGPGVKASQIKNIIQDPGNKVTCAQGASC